MANILDSLGFDTESCTPGKGNVSSGTKLIFGKDTATLDIKDEVAIKIVAMIGDQVDFGLSSGMKIAICKGTSRKLSTTSNGRRKLNLNSAKDNLLQYFPQTSKYGKPTIEYAYIDEIEFDEDNGVVIFTPTSFLYRDGTGTHCKSATDLHMG